MNIFETESRRLTQKLCGFGIEEAEARLEATLILEHVSGLAQQYQITSALKELQSNWRTQIEAIVCERKKRRPLQYILGKTSFWGLELNTGDGVLVPRSDTETLVNIVLERLSKNPKETYIADIGVGAGPIAITLIKQLSNCRVFACDVSHKAIDLAKKNASRWDVEERLHLQLGDWQQVLPQGFDVIVSNPPYISASQKNSLALEVLHEPSEALFEADGDGLSFYRNFAAILPLHFKNASGWLACEIGDEQKQAVTTIFQDAGWRQVTIHQDLNGLPRVLTAMVPQIT
jgi:release factor glutamine methyltransferase